LSRPPKIFSRNFSLVLNKNVIPKRTAPIKADNCPMLVKEDEALANLSETGCIAIQIKTGNRESKIINNHPSSFFINLGWCYCF